MVVTYIKTVHWENANSKLIIIVTTKHIIWWPYNTKINYMYFITKRVLLRSDYKLAIIYIRSFSSVMRDYVIIKLISIIKQYNLL